ncbi:hypothetical protein LIER_25473 [Lithospermum erythrorhizon]|uniref:Uncharacterized protein n=1 Tax=Lithospermum erythrorhizon TaxID=34254 RepID=A0AAV3R548_LITER
MTVGLRLQEREEVIPDRAIFLAQEGCKGPHPWKLMKFGKGVLGAAMTVWRGMATSGSLSRLCGGVESWFGVAMPCAMVRREVFT